MKKIPFALVLALGLASGSAFAATSGTVEINGKISASSCTVSGTEDRVVNLATVGHNALVLNQLTAPQRFSIKLSCPESTTVGLKFSSLKGADSVDPLSGTLINQAPGGATNVNVALYEGDGTTQIKFGQGSFGVTALDEIGKDGVLNYVTGYYPVVENPGEGAVQVSLKYVVAYE